MSITGKNIFFIIAASVLFISCSKYSKILKSDDNELKYQAALNYLKDGKNDRAANLFVAVAPYYMGSIRDDSISFLTAVCYYRMGDYITSAEILEEFKYRFQYSNFVEEAEYLIAMGYYYSSPAPNRDQTTSRLAISAFYQYLDRYPRSQRREECLGYVNELMNKIFEKEYINAKLYYDIEYYKAAVHALKVSLNDYPETPYREEMLFLITKSSYLLASHSIETLKRGRYLNVLDAYYNLISEYPETKHLKNAAKMYEETQQILKEYETKL